MRDVFRLLAFVACIAVKPATSLLQQSHQDELFLSTALPSTTLVREAVVSSSIGGGREVTLVNSDSLPAIVTAFSACARSTTGCSPDPQQLLRGAAQGADQASINQAQATIDAATAGDDTLVWLFNYGSNMHPSKLEQWHVTPKTVLRGYVTGRAVRFDTVLKSEEEPSFANLVRCYSDAACAHGTVSLISRAELNAMDRCEKRYTRESVVVTTYEGAKVVAEAYSSPREVEEHRPSERYARLVYCGGVKQQLDAAYLATLRSFLFPEEDWEQRSRSIDCDDETLIAPLPALFFEEHGN